MGRSRLGGVPTVLPPATPGPGGQLGLPLDDDRPRRRDVLPGVVHIARWLEPEVQLLGSIEIPSLPR